MHKQQGITLIGMVLTIVVVVLSAIVLMRVVPVFIQHYSIVHSIKSLNETPVSTLSDDSINNVMILRRSLTKRLDINGIDDLKEDQLTISPEDGSEGQNKYKVHLQYQVTRPLLYNMSLLFDFNDTIEVLAGSEN
jgi:hypothetical protein